MLETLNIMRIPQKLTHDPLSTIHIPKCTSFNISYSQGRDSDVSLFNDPTLTHISSLLIGHIRGSPLIKIAWRRDGAMMDLSTSKGAVTLLFTKADKNYPVTVPAGLSDALEEAGPSEIHLNLNYTTMPSAIL
ncbi:hypothetical protein FRB94_003011 [Tulasnella sp. JGI-2019a]|nr:hypothetical protein FRB94_003011 [Tulasnella sp. JGI-2019a]